MQLAGRAILIGLFMVCCEVHQASLEEYTFKIYSICWHTGTSEYYPDEDRLL